MNCPKDGHTLEFISGDFPTGVIAPDGGKETAHEEGYYCPHCHLVFEESDVSEGEI
jgi:hypothetical protein